MNINLLQNDPRIYQIAALSILVVVATAVFDIQIVASHALAIITSALGLQCLLSQNVSEALKQSPSALISALSLCLLLRTGDISIAILAALIAIGSKRVISRHGQHVFNPTAFSLVVVTLLFDNAWISPGQWGQDLYLFILIIGTGVMVSGKATRTDISLAFLVSYAGICLIRAAYLGDPIAIPLHQLGNGALLIFAFFMISDPRTTPRSRAGRLIFAGTVAAVAACIGFVFYQPNGLIYSLVICAPLVILLNKYLPGSQYCWPTFHSINPSIQSTSGVRHA
jgi:enediyne biosynthesis protein E5